MTTQADGGKQFFGHPRGLSTLFFTELWERFGYYGMRSLLILFMTAPAASGGLGFPVAKAGAIYGLYTAMVYFASMPGGWIADRILGQRSAVLYGGVLIAAGYYSLALPGVDTFYLGLAIVVAGTGLLKPNISTIVGQIYAPGDVRRDAGFSIFYMGINLGAFIAPLVCGWMGERINWRLGFAISGIGMTLGILHYVWGGGTLGAAGARPAVEDPADRRRLRLGLLVAAGLCLMGLALDRGGILHIGAQRLVDAAGLMLSLTVVGFFAWMFSAGHWEPVERKRLAVIAVLFLASAIFWSAFEQAGSSLNLFAQRSTDKQLLGFPFPASWLQSLNGLFIIVFAPVFAWLWIRLGPRDPSSPAKFAWGLVLLGFGFVLIAAGALRAESGVLVSPLWLTAMYLFHTFGELCLSPVGLSAITKLAPARVASLMMGVWFMSLATGNYLGGRLASFYEAFPLPVLFGAIAAGSIGAGLLLALFVRPIVKLMGGVR